MNRRGGTRPVNRRSRDGGDVIDEIERGFATGRAARLAALEVEAQEASQAAADSLARGNREQGVLLLISALVTTEQIDRLEGNPPS